MEKKGIINKIIIPPLSGDVNWRQALDWKRSVFPKVYMPVVLVTVWTFFLKIFYDIYREKSWIDNVFFPSSLLNYLGLVLSLLLVFRNSSAYDNFFEGRKCWASILNNARNLSRHLWIGIEIDEEDPNKEEKLNLKKGILRLVIALVVSIRHSLRGEYGWDFDDLSKLVKHVPRFNSLFTTAPVEMLKVLPLEIAYHIEGYIYQQNNSAASPMMNQSYGSINAIIENFTTCERILNSPIPVIYSIHIKHALIIYLVTLPLQIIPSCSWASIFIIFLTSFTLFGIEAISSEIENPFGNDLNDLQLDDFCVQVHKEVKGMMKFFPPTIGFADWLQCEEIEYSNINPSYTQSSSSNNQALLNQTYMIEQAKPHKSFLSKIFGGSNSREVKIKKKSSDKLKHKKNKHNEYTAISDSSSNKTNYGSISDNNEVAINIAPSKSVEEAQDEATIVEEKPVIVVEGRKEDKKGKESGDEKEE